LDIDRARVAGQKSLATLWARPARASAYIAGRGETLFCSDTSVLRRRDACLYRKSLDMSAIDFQQLVDRQYAPLYRFALSLAKSEADAADLTQQTFFLWASKGDQLRDRSKAKSWLFTTLYREFLSRRRHEVRFPKVELDDVCEEEMSILANVNAFDKATVLQALHEVEEPFRAPLTLFYLEQFSYQKIAQILDVPIGTVMSRLSRGKAQLRQRLLSKEEVLGNKVVAFQSDRSEESHG
jgi:RNA polymerase sigma factor (sigma-70 family)